MLEKLKNLWKVTFNNLSNLISFVSIAVLLGLIFGFYPQYIDNKLAVARTECAEEKFLAITKERKSQLSIEKLRLSIERETLNSARYKLSLEQTEQKLIIIQKEIGESRVIQRRMREQIKTDIAAVQIKLEQRKQELTNSRNKIQDLNKELRTYKTTIKELKRTYEVTIRELIAENKTLKNRNSNLQKKAMEVQVLLKEDLPDPDSSPWQPPRAKKRRQNLR